MGYERFPVFVNRTVKGLQSRHPLEEAKESGQSEDATAETVEEQQLHQEPAQIHLSSLPYRPYDVIQWFHHSFVVCRVDFLASHFMTPILLQPFHGPVLSLALVSVSVTRFGNVANNPGATQYGHSQYTRCLKLLQSTLDSPKLTQEDATLGCAAVLGLFEVSVSLT